MPVAWIYPGQGSQIVGMGADLLNLPEGKKHIVEAESILGWSLVSLNEDDLSNTSFVQPALFLVEAILSDLLKKKGFFPHAVAGHSLGEYSALYCAGVIDFKTGLQLVNQRAKLMETDCQSNSTMIAVIGFDRQKLLHLCNLSKDVYIANDNSEGEIVLSGLSQSVESVVDQLEPVRSLPLSVSGAFHSIFMNRSAKAFSEILNEIDLNVPRIPVYTNFTSKKTQDPSTLKINLHKQMTSPVLWRETMLNLLNDGIDEVWEIGPRDILSKLAKYADRSIKRINIANYKNIQSITVGRGTGCGFI